MATTDTNETMDGAGWTTRRWALLAAILVTFAVGIALLVATAGDSEARSCRQSGVAQVCLVADGPAYDLEGSGFRPGSEITVAGEGGTPLVVQVDATGHVPESGAKIGILADEDPQRFVLTGTAADGAGVSVELPVPAGDG